MSSYYSDLVQVYGEPLYSFQPEGNFTENHRTFCDVPYECAVFSLDHVSRVIVASRYMMRDSWDLNKGERFVIDNLINYNSISMPVPKRTLCDGISVVANGRDYENLWSTSQESKREKLIENEHKPHWLDLSKTKAENVDYLFERLIEETKELEEAILLKDEKEQIREASDCGNFADMIIDVLKNYDQIVLKLNSL